MHALVLDIDALYADAMRESSSDIDDVDLHASHPMRDPSHDELQAVFGKHHVVEGCTRHRHGQEDQQPGDDEEHSAHGERA